MAPAVRLAPRPVAHIATDRAIQIQTALIHKGYLTGAASGTWNAETVTAMQRLQADNGWQTKFVPDSRAIISLGLGPNASPGTEAAEAVPQAAGPAATLEQNERNVPANQ